MQVERGSTWKKWDFHVHTPYSILNNQFGFNPDPEWKTDIAKFDEYVRTLFTKAVEKEIAAIGITDYFCVDGYKRIREAYLNKPSKMIELFPDDELRSKVKRIYVFPNIEFRIPTFIGEKANAVNYHVIFSDRLPIQDIETVFLGQVQLQHSIGGMLPLCRKSIERIGAEYKRSNDVAGSDYLVGLNHITVDESQILELLSNDIFRDCHIISIPVDEDLSKGVPWRGRDSIARKLLCQQSHCFMTSNDSTRDWALGRDGIEAQIEEFGSIKPCIWGSDAHSFDRMFCPDEDRFCWIKAELTFEGLQQILYEPDDRVRIQREKPEEKDEHQLIDYIIFHDERFAEEPIYLNEGLTAIIGGKSTGKSILLRHIAKAIDNKQVQENEKPSYGITRPKLEATAEVFWKDGVSGERRIIYIPQSWLNSVVDESGGDTKLNAMIRGILLQQPSINSAHYILRERIAEIIAATKKNIEDYVSHVEGEKACERQLSEYGRSAAFKSSIKKLEKRREDLSTEVGITDEMLERYTALEKEIEEKTEQLIAVAKEESYTCFTKEPYVYIPDITSIEFDGSHSYDLSSIPTAREKIEQAIGQLNSAILEIWIPTIQMVSGQLTDKKKKIDEDLAELNAKFEPLKQIVARNDQLKKIDNQIQEERQRLQRANELEKEKAEHHVKANKLMTEVLSSRKSLLVAYEDFSETLSAMNSSNTDLVFLAKIEDRRKDLFDAINGLFDNRNLRAFREAGYSVTDIDMLKIDDGLFEALWKCVNNGSLTFKGGNNLQSTLEKLFSDWFYVHYIVESGNDTINSMSPGKKAMVLLELIVNLEKGKCPILIDQPEDDLDNRSIYADLVKYLRDKKRERQIIVVTHNANVVVGADAEEVIIANQTGKEAENHSKQFEYRCGAIENISPVWEPDGTIRKGVLNQKGIKEQICDILEGGKDAFEKRANKYFSMT